MRLILLVCLFFIGTFSTYAQERVTVVLKNGKTVEGKLLDALYEDFITIEYDALTRENIHLSRVNGIYFGGYQPTTPSRPVDTLYFRREKGFFHISEVQLMIGQEASGSTFSNHTLFQTINGYTWQPWLMLGLGVGVDKYGDFLISPVFASIRGTLKQQKVSPFYFLNAGWGHFWQPENDAVTYQAVKGGYHLQLGAGYQFSMEKTAILISMGYRLQDSSMEFTRNNFDWMGFERTSRVTEERLLRRIVFTMGFTF